MRPKMLTMLAGWALTIATAVALPLQASAACPGDQKKPSLTCPGDQKKPSFDCPGDQKKPSLDCPGDQKKPS